MAKSLNSKRVRDLLFTCQRIQPTDTLAEAFRHLLPDSYSYTFPDGEHDCPAAPGVEKLIPGPYLCWYPDDSLKSIAEQHEVVSEIIEDEGIQHCGPAKDNPARRLMFRQVHSTLSWALAKYTCSLERSTLRPH